MSSMCNIVSAIPHDASRCVILETGSRKDIVSLYEMGKPIQNVSGNYCLEQGLTAFSQLQKPVWIKTKLHILVNYKILVNPLEFEGKCCGFLSATTLTKVLCCSFRTQDTFALLRNPFRFVPRDMFFLQCVKNVHHKCITYEPRANYGSQHNLGKRKSLSNEKKKKFDEKTCLKPNRLRRK